MTVETLQLEVPLAVNQDPPHLNPGPNLHSHPTAIGLGNLGKGSKPCTWTFSSLRHGRGQLHFHVNLSSVLDQNNIPRGLIQAPRQKARVMHCARAPRTQRLREAAPGIARIWGKKTEPLPGPSAPCLGDPCRRSMTGPLVASSQHRRVRHRQMVNTSIKRPLRSRAYIRTVTSIATLVNIVHLLMMAPR